MDDPAGLVLCRMATVLLSLLPASAALLSVVLIFALIDSRIPVAAHDRL